MRSKSTLLVLAAVLVAAVVGYFTWRNYPKVSGTSISASQAAAAIRTAVTRDIRFVEVTVNARPNSTIFIVAPAKLPADAKIALEQIVKKNASGQRTNISYVIQIEGNER